MTEIGLLTTWLLSDAPVPPEHSDITERFKAEYGRPPAAFDALFGHGFALRDCLALMMPSGHPAMASWNTFRAFLQEQRDDWYRELVANVILNQLDFHGNPLPESDPDLTDKVEIERYARLLCQDKDDEAAATQLLGDPGHTFKALLLDLIDATWRAIDIDTSNSWRQQLVNALNKLTPATTNLQSLDQAFQKITGRRTPKAERERLEGCSQITFLITVALNQVLSISYVRDRAFVAFEPAPDRDLTLEQVETFSALGNELRLRILLALAEHGELFGTELVELLDAPQATVSNHLNVLQSAGLVGRRPQGRRVYYTLIPASLETALALIEQLQSERI